MSAWTHGWLPKATQTYGVNNFDSLVARLHSIRILLSVAVVKQRLLSQLDIKNAFLYEFFKSVYASPHHTPPIIRFRGDEQGLQTQKSNL